MQIKTIAVAAAFAASAALASAAAAAPTSSGQPAQAAPPPPPAMNGPAIPGLCMLSDQEVYGGSVVGKYVIGRLQQLGQQAEAELGAETTQLQNDAKALDAQRSTMTADQYDQRAAALQLRDRERQRKIQLRQREMQATQEQAFATVNQQADPIIRQVVSERNCSVLLNGAAVVAVGPSMDISPAVIQRLDAKIQQFPLDRVHLDTAAAGPQEQ
jgi:outer membrane protein